MDDKIILRIWGKCFLTEPDAIERCAVGQGNYVYIVVCGDKMYVLRCSEEKGAYEDTVRWLNQLSAIGVPVPAVIAKGYCEAWEYLVLSYLEGQDIGLVYSGLSREEKKKIATEVVDIQRKVSVLKLDGLEMDWSWTSFVEELLDRAEKRIEQNGYFEVEKVERIRHQMWVLEEYFTSVKPIAYLDDISSKNLLIHEGKLSGIIDVDWIGVGDRLTFVALTHMALLNLEYDTDYVKYLLEELRVTEEERRAFLFYTLMYCVDFMGERGMQFGDKRIEVNEQIVMRLNGIYDWLWKEWCEW